jgi:hypothetical protein
MLADCPETALMASPLHYPFGHKGDCVHLNVGEGSVAQVDDLNSDRSVVQIGPDTLLAR